MRPLIFIANDDGIDAVGINTLAEALSDLGEILVVAPDRERSAASHAFTMTRPLRVEEVRPGWFSVDGTPVDCVYLGMLKLASRKPALLVSGINHGLNLGADVFYSGTVACAVEGAIREVPSIAVSLDQMGGSVDFGPAARIAHALAHAALVEGLPAGTLLNVNVPAGPAERYSFTRLGKRLYRDSVVERADLRGREYYWLGGPVMEHGDIAGTDSAAVRDKIVSVTPLGLDLTHHGLLEKLPGWAVHGFESVIDDDLAQVLSPTDGQVVERRRDHDVVGRKQRAAGSDEPTLQKTGDEAGEEAGE